MIKEIDDHVTPCTVTDKILLDRLARIETELKVRFEERDKTHHLERLALDKEFNLFREFVNTKFHDLNQLRQEVVEDRADYFLKDNQDIYSESVKKETREIKIIVDRNSDRLTNIENLHANKSELHRELENIKYFHSTDVAPMKEKLTLLDKLNLPQLRTQSDGQARLVWIGIGIVIATQIFFHYFFKQIAV